MHHTLLKERYESETLMTLDSHVTPRWPWNKIASSPPKRKAFPTTPAHAYVKKGDKQEKRRMQKRTPSLFSSSSRSSSSSPLSSNNESS